MKKLITGVTFLLFFINNPGLCFLPTPQQEKFGPQPELLQQEFGKPKDMVNIVPGRPIAARDKYGNRLYFTPDGKLTLRINLDGNKEFSLKHKSKQYDSEGNLERVTEKQRGTRLVEIKNEKGEILGYQELGLGGKVIKEYDKDMNLVNTYKYNTYGKKLEYIENEETRQKTMYDEKGRNKSIINFEGTEIAWFEYDEDGKIKTKTDIEANKTYFDKYGNITHIEDRWGNIVKEYKYERDREGNIVVEETIEGIDIKLLTYYKNGKPQVTKTVDGDVVVEYHYDGSTLRFTFNRFTKETVWYDIDGKPLYSSRDGYLSKKWFYYEGKLVGLWDESNNSVTVFVHGQQVGKYYVPYMPKEEEVYKAASNIGKIYVIE